MSAPEPVTRPNGKLYRPRKVTGHAVANEDDEVTAIIVLGTHDITRAQALANQCAAAWVDGGYVAVDPITGWFRNGYEYGCRAWVDDPGHGRAGVWFRKIVEASQ